jgi:hypothetical protein
VVALAIYLEVAKVWSKLIARHLGDTLPIDIYDHVDDRVRVVGIRGPAAHEVSLYPPDMSD